MGVIAKETSFAGTHKWDRDFFLLTVAAVWTGILMGFVPEIVHNAQQHKAPYPIVVHFHAVAFTAWLCLLTSQILLIRIRRVDLHRRLGVAGICLYPAIVVLGFAVAVIIDRSQFGTPDFNPAFISSQIGAIISFAIVAGAGIGLRKSPPAHKRLMLLATIFIAPAGFARWWGAGLATIFGHGFLGAFLALHLSDLLLVLLMGCYDLITRHRLHPAYVFGASVGLGMDVVAVWLYVSPWWRPVATSLLGL